MFLQNEKVDLEVRPSAVGSKYWIWCQSRLPEETKWTNEIWLEEILNYVSSEVGLTDTSFKPESRGNLETKIQEHWSKHINCQHFRLFLPYLPHKSTKSMKLIFSTTYCSQRNLWKVFKQVFGFTLFRSFWFCTVSWNFGHLYKQFAWINERRNAKDFWCTEARKYCQKRWKLAFNTNVFGLNVLKNSVRSLEVLVNKSKERRGGMRFS